eukprot:gene7875-9983_t
MSTQYILPANTDATLYEEGGANGAGLYTFAGRNGANQIRRTVIRFSLETLPPDVIVSSARIMLHVADSIFGNVDVDLHLLTSSWTEGPSVPTEDEAFGVSPQEGDVTWLHRSFPHSFWQKPGGDFKQQPVAGSVAGSANTFIIFEGTDLTNTLNQIRHNNRNNGFLLKVKNENNISLKKFESRRNPSTQGVRPIIILVFFSDRSPDTINQPDNTICCVQDDVSINSNRCHDGLSSGR